MINLRINKATLMARVRRSQVRVADPWTQETIRDRVVELRRVPANTIKPHPENWKTHGDTQRDVLRGLLKQIGFADVVLAREVDGELYLIDGHMRQNEMGTREVPVVILDVSEDEARLMLATLDPLAAMATGDGHTLRALLEKVNTDSQPVADMLTALAEQFCDIKIPQSRGERPQVTTEHTCPACGHTW